MAPVPMSQIDLPTGSANYVSKRKLVPDIQSMRQRAGEAPG